MTLRAILFDLDGTLHDKMATHRAVLKAASPSPRVWLCTESLPEIAAFIQSHA